MRANNPLTPFGNFLLQRLMLPSPRLYQNLPWKVRKVWLVVGLGNPGKKYQETRHNIGFQVVDYLVREEGEKWKKDWWRKAMVARLKVYGEDVIVAKPQTFMNLSGKAVAALQRAYQLPPSRVLVVCDDLDLPLGTIRLRRKGSTGGHHGLASVAAALETEEFPRLRVGIGRPPEKEEVIAYVLSPFRPEERETLREVIPRAAGALKTAVTQGLERAMNLFN